MSIENRKTQTHITAKLKRELVLMIDPEKLYPVKYWFNQNREIVNTPSMLKGKDLTENQIIDLWKDGII